MNEKLDLYFAVFNQTPADHRAGVRAVNAKFGPGAYRKHVEPYKRNGIMTIFSEHPNQYTQCYAEAVTDAVNQRRGAK